MRIRISNSLSLRSCQRRRESSKDGEDSLMNAAFGLRIVGADDIGVVSLKTSGVGCRGWQGGLVFKVSRVWLNTLRKSLGLGQCSFTCFAII